ncbi:response regulator transcription factor [Aliivibrio fischeri]|uniref:response regulator transcription factor n=1 Tax=Aliivibrio fischeri TaxID=668 RepID=UPI0012DA73E0|nr:response regulator transcription factor [Aliivibrio fischeri]MUJ36721.1 response regulator [Aliivibrio fischeri]
MSTIKKINTLVLDSHPIVIESITQQLKTIENIGEIYQSSSMIKALDLIEKNHIEFIILDIKQNEFNGLEFINKIKKNGFSSPILVLSSYGYEIYSDSVKNLGANGYISKEEPVHLFNDAIVNILKGYILFKAPPQKNKHTGLSNREIIVLNHLLNGYSNKQISELLFLSTKTISTYKTRILKKYNANSLVDLIRLNNYIME